MTGRLAGLALIVAAVSPSVAVGQQATAPAATAAAEFPGDAKLRAAYAFPQSRFATIDGEVVHYVDEGPRKAPTVVLIHGSYGSLRDWDSFAGPLSRRYRVVRYDLGPSGLSGPNPRYDYSTEQRVRVLDGLMDKLGVARFAVIGTSSGGLPAAAYAAMRPRRVSALVLNNIASGAFKIDFGALPQSLQDIAKADAAHPGWHSAQFWREILLNNSVDKSRVTPAVVERWRALNDRALGDPAIGKAIAAQTSFARTPADLRAISAPALVLWSAQDHETTLAEHGQRTLDLLGSKDKQLAVIDQCGHAMPIDCPQRALVPIEKFLKRAVR